MSSEMKKKIVGDDKINANCIPFVSEYSDCSEANLCSGCTRCSCNADGEWKCESIFECPIENDNDPSEPESVPIALDVLYSEIKNKKKKPRVFVPPPPTREDDLLVPDVKYYEEDFSTYMARQKRSSDFSSEDSKKNHTIDFYHTVDEINEDILKGTNDTGTIKAMKVDTQNIPKLSRRTSLLDKANKSALKDFNIQLNSNDYDPHIAENKIDLDLINKNYLKNLNYSQEIKNKDLSNLVVSELKRGTEVIGDKNVSPMSNITFTSENDTLTAMTFIAGNLLNKLWDMEKETSDTSMDVESLKHKKINDLLELFKEPLSIRQETFLKNALEKLSDTLNKNKNIKNVSLCETITDSELSSDNESDKIKNSNRMNTTKCSKEKNKNVSVSKVNNKDEKLITSNVISKLSNVLNLMKKFEQVQKNLTDLKNDDLNIQSHELNLQNEQIKTRNSSMHIFSNLLEKITELLIPNNGSKKVTNKLKNLHQFNSNNLGKNVLKNKYHIDIENNNLTIKDKLLLDYLNHIESNPNCIFSEKYQKYNEKRMNIESNILYNLSEFFKIKSMIDLVKLTKSETKSTVEITSTTEKILPVTKAMKVLRDSKIIDAKEKSRNLNVTKEKLKSHLRAIIDDLLELQNDNETKSINKINILDALPCIYKMLNNNKLNTDPILSKTTSDPLNKMKMLIDSLKLDFTSLPTRRNLIATERPKSAKVWERIVKNVNNQMKTRRNFNSKKPKSYDEIKDIMEKVESVGNSYKNFAMLSVIPPQKRLMLLKTLEADTKQKTLALEKIKDSTDILEEISSEKRNELKEFIDNVKNHINLSAKVLDNLEKTKSPTKFKNMVEIFQPSKNININNKQNMINLLKTDRDGSSNVRISLTRDQIMSKLIENRIKLYLASKEVKGVIPNDISYNIGKRILTLIREGNIDLAKELYSIFMNNNKEEITKRDKSEAAINVRQTGPLLLALKEPLIRFIEPSKGMEIKTPEMLLRQLVNLKNINLK